MAWYAYIRDSDGALLSLSTTSDQVAAGITVTELAIDPTDPAHMYDQNTRTFISRPAKVLADRLQDIITNPAYGDDLITLWNTLNAANRTRLRNGLIRLLGRHRFRAQGEGVELD